MLLLSSFFDWETYQKLFLTEKTPEICVPSEEIDLGHTAQRADHHLETLAVSSLSPVVHTADPGLITMASPLAITASDLWAMSAEIKQTVTGAIAELRADLQSMNAKITTMETTVQQQDQLLQRVHKKSQIHDYYLLEMHYHFEDLDNRGRRSNLRIRGIPESVGPA